MRGRNYATMKKRETRAQQYENYADVVAAMREGRPVKRIGRRDRSIATHPVVPVTENLLENDVLARCLSWLRKNRIVCNRNNVGTGQMGTSGIYSYGIKDAGDIIGLLPKNGQHFEIEVKRSGGGRLSLGQQKRMEKIRENNGLYFVVHGDVELVYYLEKYL